MKSVIVSGCLVLSFVLAAATSADAQSKKKMTYQEAFAKCKQEIGAGAPGSESLSSSQRYTAGSGCMQKYGFRLKKKAKI